MYSGRRGRYGIDVGRIRKDVEGLLAIIPGKV